MNPKEITRRDTLKLSGLALGGLALGNAGRAGADCTPGGTCYPTDEPTHRYSLFRTLDEFVHPTPVRSDEMRITFIGSGFPPPRRAQQEMSVFVEVGDGGGRGEPDQVLFDVGWGVTSNYNAMGISFGRMNKIFVNHLHGDHMGELAHIYCFGPAFDRKSPLYVWGPGPSGVRSPRPPCRTLSSPLDIPEADSSRSSYGAGGLLAFCFGLDRSRPRLALAGRGLVQRSVSACGRTSVSPWRLRPRWLYLVLFITLLRSNPSRICRAMGWVDFFSSRQP